MGLHRRAWVFAGGALGVAAVSCGAQTADVTCGAGNAECEATNLEGGPDGTVRDAAGPRMGAEAGLDAPDIGTPPDSQPTDDADALRPDVHVDGVPDLCPDLDAGSDPYLTLAPPDAGAVINCDPNCGAVTPGCGQAGRYCAEFDLSNAFLPAVVRTPQAPGTQQCFAACIPQVASLVGVAYGVVGHLTDIPTQQSVIVRVAEPWEIIVASSDGCSTCPDYGAPTFMGCAVVPYGLSYVYIVTKDPNAPARNITFTLNDADDGGGCP